MPSYINAIGTAVPTYKLAQSDIVHFMARAHQMNEAEKRRLVALYRASGIHYRHSVLADFGQTDNFSFFGNTATSDAFPGTDERMRLYKKEALRLSKDAVKHCLQEQSVINNQEITHLIVVSCTGMYAPGLDIELVSELQLSPHVQRSCIYFMGCYAAFNALKSADYILRADADAKVLVVCTELCTIHFQREKNEDTLLSNALFADGAAAVLLSAQPAPGHPQLELEQFHCDLSTEGKQEMAWWIGDQGFEMKLSTYVPDIIKKGIVTLSNQLWHKLAQSGGDIRDFQPDYYAIHPGGKRILEVVEEALGMDKEDNRFAYRVLQQYGNMSSPTVLFVLQQIFRQLQAADRHKRILSFAFGPGLTMESMLLKIHSH
jgi:predicted naringenin-chalcone synthase